ncbi:HET-domain-containing protein [Saccharata proteae CBS 121410]|uniref:HET-domain-containing protein n=1 Tax=Saccharata proteae CBS 121410 TaxID=1314787 RepID=A0A9P4HUT5_9PEZI|nr:HET-domain-containing protein [Saccharata proteae CBS 121410]
MAVVRLSHCVVFSALSYTWGSQVRDVAIHCDGAQLLITRNLAHALLRIRSEQTARVLWVDAVCINQDCLQERAQQVGLMRRIYECATSVVIWLGEASEDSPSAFRLIKQIHEAAVNESGNGSPSDRPLDAEELRNRNLPNPQSSDWKAIEKVWRRPWFRRIWIIQELVLANRAMLFCGSSFVTWEQLETAAWFIHRHSLPVNYTVFVTELSIHKIEYRTQRHPLLTLLVRTSASEATNPRDKVYGLLGICSETDAKEIVPDDEKPIPEVFLDVALLHLRRGNLGLLTALADPRWRLTPCLPSWVPDWPYDPRVMPLGYLPGMNAGSNLMSQVRFSAADNALFVSAVIVDRIRIVGRWMTLSSSEIVPGRVLENIMDGHVFLVMRSHVLNQWRRLAQGVTTYPTGDRPHEVFCRIVIANAFPRPSGGNGSMYPTMDELFQATVDTSLQPVDTNASDRIWQEHPAVKRGVSPAEVRAASVAYADALTYASPDRRFFISKKGYMGLAPRSARPGDFIVVLAGGKTPFVLRHNKKDAYKIVGECFMHGVMNGERVVSVNAFEEIKIV